MERRVPFLSSFLMDLLMLFFIILAIFYLIMLPTKYASPEMSVGYYIIVVPETLKTFSFYSLIGILIILPLYYKLRLHKPAILTFQDEYISIVGKKINFKINNTNVGKVFCNDLKNAFGQLKEKLQIVIIEKAGKTTTFYLKNYNQAEEFMDVFSTVKEAKFSFYDNEMPTDHEDE